MRERKSERREGVKSLSYNFVLSYCLCFFWGGKCSSCRLFPGPRRRQVRLRPTAVHLSFSSCPVKKKTKNKYRLAASFCHASLFLAVRLVLSWLWWSCLLFVRAR